MDAHYRTMRSVYLKERLFEDSAACCGWVGYAEVRMPLKEGSEIMAKSARFLMRPRGLFRAIGDFLTDLLAGEPVPLIFLGVILLFVIVVALWGVKILRDKRRQDEERQKRWRKSGTKRL
jgi:hypothetical protein